MWTIIGVIIGVSAVLGTIFIQKKNIEQAKQEESKLMDEASRNAEQIMLDAKKRSKESIDEAVHEIEIRKEHIDKLQDKMSHKESILNARIKKVEEYKAKLREKQEYIASIKVKLDEITDTQIEELAKKINIKSDQVKDLLMEDYERQFKEENKDYLSKYGEESAEDAEKRSQNLLRMAIQRYSSETSRDQVATVVDFKNKKNR